MKPTTLALMLIVGMLYPLAANSMAEYVLAQTNGCGIYAERQRTLYEKPLTSVPSGTPLLVVSRCEDKLYVRTENDLYGWVEKRLVAVAPHNTRFEFDAHEVHGYLDTRDMIVIFDRTDPGEYPLVVSRSFADNLRENRDRDLFDLHITRGH